MKGKKLVILGAGESGIGAALLASKKKYKVFVSDYGEIRDSYKQELKDYNIPFEERGHTFDIIGESDLIIKSPGVAEKTGVMQFIRKKKIPVISEIEFAFRYCEGKVIAITGSNGKTTTTELSYHLLSESGMDVVKAGNIGESFARSITKVYAGYYVLEISSFQLDDIETFKPDIAVLLNITPDHLDRYGFSMDAYAEAKMKIAQNQDERDYFLVNMDDPELSKRVEAKEWNQQVIEIRYPTNIDQIDTKVSSENFEMTNVRLKGRHNMLNATMAIRIAELVGVEKEDIQRALESFENVAHRMEKVARINGVKYINDSKATNVDAVFFALESMNDPVVWIAGGTDKGNDYSVLDKLAKEKIKALVCLGVDNEKLKEHFKEIIPNITETQDVNCAVQMAQDRAEEGWIVLLSPACASFDLFKNYEDRGDKFKNAIWQLL